MALNSMPANRAILLEGHRLHLEGLGAKTVNSINLVSSLVPPYMYVLLFCFADDLSLLTAHAP